MDKIDNAKCTFSCALDALKDGRKIRNSFKTYRLYKNDMGDWCLAMEYPINGFSFADMMSEDWEIVDE